MPAQGKWAIRMFSPFDTDNESLTFVGSFDNADGRFHDDVVVFSGMYGIPDFMLWYVHEDMESYDFSKFSLDLRLYLVGDVDKVFHQDQYRVVSISDDKNSSRKVIYAIQEEYALVRSLIFDAEVFSLPHDKTRGPVKLLREVLTANGILPVVYMEHFDKDKQTLLFEYPTFAFEPDWTVFDFIDYVAEENGLEWTIKNGILFIGPELWTYEKLNATDPIDAQEVLRIVKTPHVMKLYSFGMPLDVLYNYEYKQGQNMTPVRCVWVKHQVGAAGDKTIGCFVDIGTSISEEIYIDSLEGDKEIGEAYYNFSKKRLFKQIKVGAVVLDESEDGYDSKFIEQITFEKKFEHWTKKTPRDRILNKDDPSYMLHKIGRTTPYLGSSEGMLFPTPETPANFIMLMPDDRIENTVQGPFVMGNGSQNFIVIKKNAKDFRLKFPDGGELYYNAQTKLWHLNADAGIVFKDNVVDADDLPSMGLIQDDIDKERIIIVLRSGGFQIEGKIPLFILEPGGCFRIAPTLNDQGVDVGRYELRGFNDLGRIDMYADNKINIKISKTGGEIDIAIGPDGTYPGTVNINCGGTVNIGANATAVNLAGGGNKLSHATHTHPIPPGPAIPGPPVNTSVHLPTDGTIKTQAD